MILKIVSLFLIAMLVLAMFGKLRIPRKKVAKCSKCGAPKIGASPCVCGKKVR